MGLSLPSRYARGIPWPSATTTRKLPEHLEGSNGRPDRILQRLHDSEINASLSWFYDDGFKWELGDNINGWTTDGRASTAREANELTENAFAEFPARSPIGGRE